MIVVPGAMNAPLFHIRRARTVFGIDIVVELQNSLLDDPRLTRWQLSHLVTETIAVGRPLLGIFPSQREGRGLRHPDARKADTLAHLQGHSEDIPLERFKARLRAIFHTAGIGTRRELLGLFLDAFLDFGTARTQDQAARAVKPLLVQPVTR
jgi:hypothetical protein